MVRIGKVYELHFGKQIFCKYEVIDIDYDTEVVTLRRIENYFGASDTEIISLKSLYKKRKIYNW